MANQLSTNQLIHIINDAYLTRIWPDVAPLLGAFAIDGAATTLAAQGMKLRLSQTSIDLTKVPELSAANGGVVLRFPRAQFTNNSPSDKYQLKTVVEAKGGVFSIDARLSTELAIGAGAPLATPSASVDVDGKDFVGVFAEFFNNLGCIDIEGQVETQFESALTSNMGAFNALRWIEAPVDSTPLQHVAGVPWKMGLLDLVCVPDGFVDMAFFDLIVERFAAALMEPLADHTNEPLYQYRSVTSVFKLPIVATNTNPSSPERVVSTFIDSVDNSVKTSMGNLARYAAILHEVVVGETPPIIVVIANESALANSGARATAHGNLVMMPAKAAPTNAAGQLDAAAALVEANRIAQVLIHELGHTIIGGLADEYDGGSNAAYRGPEPSAPNVSRQNVHGKVKWSNWLTHPAWAPSWEVHPVSEGNEGAFYRASGVFRPASDCKMRTSVGVPFCAVCREALVTKLATFLPDFVSVEATRLAPVSCPSTETWGSFANGSLITVVSAGESTQLRLRVARASLPQPWQVSWTHRKADGTVIASLSADEVTLDVAEDDKVGVSVSAVSAFAPMLQLPILQREIYFVGSALPKAAPSSPTDLVQNVPLGMTLTPTFSPATGQRQFFNPLKLSASAGAVPGYDDPDNCIIKVGAELLLKSEQGGQTLLRQPDDPGTVHTWSIADLEPGNYHWSVRTRWHDKSSASAELSLATGAAGHFTVALATPFPKPQQPHVPVDLSWQRVEGAALKARLSATSWDVNLEPLTLEFELVSGSSFNGTPTPFNGSATAKSGPHPPPAGADLRVVAEVEVELAVARHRWQVRAVSDNGQTSAWVEGPEIPVDDGVADRWGQWPWTERPRPGFPWWKLDRLSWALLTPLAGRWQFERGAIELRVDNRSGEAWLGAEGQQAIDRLSGASAREQAARAALNASADKIVRALAAGDATALASVVERDHQERARDALTTALGHGRSGAIRSVSVRGTAPAVDGIRRTVLRIVQERGWRDIALDWRGDRLLGVTSGAAAEGPVWETPMRAMSDDTFGLGTAHGTPTVRFDPRGASPALLSGRARTQLARPATPR